MTYTEEEIKVELDKIRKDNDSRIAKSPMLIITFDNPKQLARFHEALMTSEVWDGEPVLTKNVSPEEYTKVMSKLDAGFPEELLPMRYEELNV